MGSLCRVGTTRYKGGTVLVFEGGAAALGKKPGTTSIYPEAQLQIRSDYVSEKLHALLMHLTAAPEPLELRFWTPYEADILIGLERVRNGGAALALLGFDGEERPDHACTLYRTTLGDAGTQAVIFDFGANAHDGSIQSVARFTADMEALERLMLFLREPRGGTFMSRRRTSRRPPGRPGGSFG